MSQLTFILHPFIVAVGRCWSICRVYGPQQERICSQRLSRLAHSGFLSLTNPGFNDAGDGIEKNMSFLVIVNHKLHSTTIFLVSSTNAKKKSKKEIEQQQKKFT